MSRYGTSKASFNHVSTTNLLGNIFLIAYIAAGETGLTGGYYRPPGAAGQMMQSSMMDPGAEAPKMFRIREAPDTVKAFRVSKDAVIAAAVFGNDEIHIYRLFD